MLTFDQILADLEKTLGFDRPPDDAEVARSQPLLHPHQRAERVKSERVEWSFRRGPVELARTSRGTLCERCCPAIRGRIGELTLDSGALVIGPSGCGKSTAATVALRDWILRQPPARIGYWYRVADLEAARRNHRLGAGEAPDVERAIEAHALVLDDLGWERDQQVVRDVLAERADKCRPTLVTSGLRAQELMTRYGDAILRRIVDGTGQKGVVIDAW